jgi:hypothetical protein
MSPKRDQDWAELISKPDEETGSEPRPSDDPFNDHEVRHRIGQLIARIASRLKGGKQD